VILETFAGYLADGLAPAVQILDPEAIILAGGMAAQNEALCQLLKTELSRRVLAPQLRDLDISTSTFGAYAGVVGAAALTLLASSNKA
jgi:glucokinase